MSTPARQEAPIDKLMNDVGAFGKYQLMILLMIGISKFPIAFNQMAIVFINPKTEFKCPSNPTDKCPCDDPEYDTKIFPRTLVTDYHLICDKKWMGGIHQTIFQFGTLVGSLSLGVVSDKYGRRNAMLLAIVMQIVAGFITTLLKNFWVLTIVRMIVGISTGGTIVIGFVIMMEFTGGKCRESISLIFQFPFICGTVTLPLVSYFIRSYDKLLFAIAIVNCFQLVYFIILPETPRWLLTFHKTEKVIKTLERVAKCNNRPADIVRPAVLDQQSHTAPSTRKGTLIEVFRSPNMRKNLLAMGLNWFASSFGYYGLYQYMGQLSGDVFLNVAFGGILTLIGTLLGLPIIKIFGRKTITMTIFVMAAGFLALSAILSGIIRVIFACIGVMANYYAFTVVYLWCVEMFPTMVRNAAMGFASMLARVGSMVAPLVISFNDSAVWLPPAIFAAVPLFAAIVTFFALPETKGLDLASTMSEGDRIGKK